MRETNWCIITGAPCSGKTTVINILEQLGYPVVHEAARKFIEKAIAAGALPDDIRRDPFAFQNGILEAKLQIERRLSEEDTVFIDRGIPDSIAYFRLSGLDPKTPVAHAHRVRYRRIFFFERLPLVSDAVRNEPPETVARIEILLLAAYRMLGYSIIQVPVLPMAARTDYILAHL